MDTNDPEVMLLLTQREALAVLDAALTLRLDLRIDKPALRSVEDKAGDALRKAAAKYLLSRGAIHE